MTASCWGVVVAAGRGERFGGDCPKALIELGGTALVVHAVRALRVGGCAGIVVAAAPDQAAAIGDVLAKSFGAEPDRAVSDGAVSDGAVSDRAEPDRTEPDGAVDGLAPLPSVVVVAGGHTRHASVSAALSKVPADVAWVLVHDAARPLVPPAVVLAVRTALADGAAAVIPVVSVVDTIKSVDAGGLVTGTVDRTAIRRAQTPQGFERALLVRALEESTRNGQDVTDDAAAVAALGVPVLTVPGDERSLKITIPADLLHAEALLREVGR